MIEIASELPLLLARYTLLSEVVQILNVPMRYGEGRNHRIDRSIILSTVTSIDHPKVSKNRHPAISLRALQLIELKRVTKRSPAPRGDGDSEPRRECVAIHTVTSGMLLALS